MAMDWIKMRTDIYRDPKVVSMADILGDEASDLFRYVNQNLQCDMAVTRNVLRNAVVGALVSVWGVLRRRGIRINDDLLVKNCSLLAVDDIADLQGFGEAMQAVGWISETKEGFILPKFFEEYNVDPNGKTDITNAERQKRFRERNRNADSNALRVTEKALRNAPREEKRREDNNKCAAHTYSESEIESVYKAYSRKVGHKKALDSIRSALLRIAKRGDIEPLTWLLDRVKTFSASPAGQAGKFTPHPTTWFNQERYDDDTAEWQRTNGSATDHPSRVHGDPSIYDGLENNYGLGNPPEPPNGGADTSPSGPAS